MTLTRVGSTTLDGTSHGGGGICVWDYEFVYDVDVSTGIAQRTSPAMPQLSGEFSPMGIGHVDTDGSFWVACCSNVGYPLFRHLSKDFSTWETVGTWTDSTYRYYTAGVVRVGTTLVTVAVGHGFNEYYMLGYSLDGNTLLWSVLWEENLHFTLTGPNPDWDAADEADPLTLRTDGHRYVYFTVSGSVIYQFDAVSHSAPPSRLMNLLDDPATYYEDEAVSGTDPRLDIDINACWPHTDGVIYSWGANVQGLTNGSVNRNSVFAYRSPASGGYALIGQGVDPIPNLTRNYRSFSGTCCVRGSKLYLLNDHLEPYISSFDINTGVYTTVEVALQGEVAGFPASVNGFFGSAPGVIKTGKMLAANAVYEPVRPLA